MATKPTPGEAARSNHGHRARRDIGTEGVEVPWAMLRIFIRRIPASGRGDDEQPRSLNQAIENDRQKESHGGESRGSSVAEKGAELNTRRMWSLDTSAANCTWRPDAALDPVDRLHARGRVTHSAAKYGYHQIDPLRSALYLVRLMAIAGSPDDRRELHRMSPGTATPDRSLLRPFHRSKVLSAVLLMAFRPRLHPRIDAYCDGGLDRIDAVGGLVSLNSQSSAATSATSGHSARAPRWCRRHLVAERGQHVGRRAEHQLATLRKPAGNRLQDEGLQSPPHRLE